MGATYREACHESALEAASAMCGMEFPRTDIDAGGNLRVQSCVVVDAATLSITSVVPATAASAVTSVPVAFTTCDPYEHFEQLSLYYQAGAAALVLVAIVAMIYRPFTQNQ